MTGRTGRKTRKEPGQTTSRRLPHDCFDAFMPLRAIMAFVNPGISELP